MSKPFWHSKTLWLNGLTGLFTFVMSSADLLPPEAGKYIALFLVGANLILRMLTSKGIGG